MEKIKVDKLHDAVQTHTYKATIYHADLNPIELVRVDVKGRVGKSLTNSLESKKELCRELMLNFVMADKWKKCEHVINIEQKMLLRMRQLTKI